MCDVENEIRGTDTNQISGDTLPARSMERETQSGSRRPVDKGWEAAVRLGYPFTLHASEKLIFLVTMYRNGAR